MNNNHDGLIQAILDTKDVLQSKVDEILTKFMSIGIDFNDYEELW